jgi:hypothetical protein
MNVTARCALLAMMLFAATANDALPAAGSVLDRSTGATIQHSTAAWVLALEQLHMAAHTRDYLALYAVEINIAGKRRYHLAAFFWSTVPGRTQYASANPTVTLRVGDRELKLDPLGKTPRDMGISRWPLKLPGKGAVFAVYEVDEALLRALASAQPVLARPESDPTLPADVWFEVWRSGDRAFADFCKRTLD